MEYKHKVNTHLDDDTPSIACLHCEVLAVSEDDIVAPGGDAGCPLGHDGHQALHDLILIERPPCIVKG